MSAAGDLGDEHVLSSRARRYANAVISGDEWPLTAAHVDLTRVTFETSTRMQRRHGVCAVDGDGRCTIRVAERTHKRGGFEAIKETLRHELVHAYQYQTDGIDPGHGPSFTQWVDRLNLSGRCSHHYESRPEDYRYRLYCTQGCGFIAGRYRWSAVVRRAILGTQVCATCDGTLRVDGPDGTLDEVPEGG